MTVDPWPLWLPKSARVSAKLTPEQLAYILPVFTTCRGGKRGQAVDGVALCGDTISGIRPNIITFLRRFEFSDIDVKNLRDATQ